MTNHNLTDITSNNSPGTLITWKSHSLIPPAVIDKLNSANCLTIAPRTLLGCTN